MKDKVTTIILAIVFLGLLVGLSFYLKGEDEKKLNPNNQVVNNKEERSMKVLSVTNENFENEVLKSDKPVLIDFYADWCGPCKMLSPLVDQFAEENDDVKVVKINVDEAQEIAVKYGVMSIPTLVVIKNGNEVNRSVGLIGKEDIEKLMK